MTISYADADAGRDAAADRGSMWGFPARLFASLGGGRAAAKAEAAEAGAAEEADEGAKAVAEAGLADRSLGCQRGLGERTVSGARSVAGGR